MNIKHKLLFGIWSIIALILLAGCGISPGDEVVLTKTPSPISTETPLPHLTPTPTYTLFPTAPPFFLPTPPPNAPTADVADWSYYRWNLTSPDGQWVADYILNELKIYHHTGTLLWEISYKKDTPEIYFSMYMDIHTWSSDSRYIYFSPAASNDGGYLRALGHMEELWRLDITSGELKEILPSSHPGDFRSIAVLPDKNVFAHVQGYPETMPVDLIIQDLTTGEEITRYPIGQNAFIAGSLRWSPDGKTIFYIKLEVDVYNDRNMPEIYSYILMMINVGTGEITRILDMGDPGYFIYPSDKPNIIKLEKVGYQNVCEIFYFDIYKKVIVGIMTPTPDPMHDGLDYCLPTPTTTQTPLAP